MKSISIWFLILFLSVSVHPVSASDPANVVSYVTGSGNMQDNNTDIARDQAISNSLVNAVDRAIGEILPQDTLISQFKTLNETFYQKTGSYIREYQVMAEAGMAATYRVLVQATVLMENIRNELARTGLLMTQKNLPKILFLVAEQGLYDLLPGYWWGEEPSFVLASSEKGMAAFFKEKGFHVIDHTGMTIHLESPESEDADLADEPLYDEPYSQDVAEESSEISSEDNTSHLTPYLGNENAVRIASQLGAEVAITGLAMVEIVPNTMGDTARSYKGIAEIKALKVDTGEEILSTKQTAVAMNVDEKQGASEALFNAGWKASSFLIDSVVKVWKERGEESLNLISIRVQGTKNLGHFVTFRRTLSRLEGIKELKMKEIMANEAILEVDYADSVRSLADTLMVQTFDNFGINIDDLTPNSLTVELVQP